MRLAASRTFCTAGTSRPMRMAMMEITTKSSMRVKADRERDIGYLLRQERPGYEENARDTARRATEPLAVWRSRRRRFAITLRVRPERRARPGAGARQ